MLTSLLDSETSAETIESGPLCITDLFHNIFLAIIQYVFCLYAMQLFSVDAKISLKKIF